MAYKDLYRFQGSNSCSLFEVFNKEIHLTRDNMFVYVSKSFDHHAYFSYKRLRYLLAEIANDEYGIVFANHMLSDNGFYRKMQEGIAFSTRVSNLESLSFKVDSSFTNLIDQNSVRNVHKKEDDIHTLERVDRRAYGGGYGLPPEWAELLKVCTLQYTRRKISRNDLLILLRKIRERCYAKNEVVDFLKEDRIIIPNRRIESSFLKYEIRYLLEEIMDKRLYNPDSELGKKPKQMIKEISDDFIKVRDEFLLSRK